MARRARRDGSGDLQQLTRSRGPGYRTPNWITTSWPPETQTILAYQWNEVALSYWRVLAGLGRRKGIRFAVEMHGMQLGYNADTLLRLREAVGDVIRVTLDPSHSMWRGPITGCWPAR